MDNKKQYLATIAASPTIFSWSQSYNAGSLFAVVSIKNNAVENQENISLLGKDFLNSLEAEYFTLETKTLDSLKQAIRIASEKMSNIENLHVSMVIASLVNNVLYVFALGQGKAILKRENNIGTILTTQHASSLTSASGFLEDDDIVVLGTEQFFAIIPDAVLTDALLSTTLSEITEVIAPHIHNQEEGGAAAIVFGYKEKEEQPIEVPQNETVAIHYTVQETLRGKFAIKHTMTKIKNFLFSRLMPLVNRISLTHRKKVFLTIICILAVVFLVSIMLTIKRQNDEKTKALFQNVVSQAQKKYDEGEGLTDLNKNLARDDFVQAQKILLDGKSKFSKNSLEAKQIEDFLKKVNNALAAVSGSTATQAKSVDLTSSTLLAIENKNIAQKNLFFTQDEKNIYGIDDTGIVSFDKKTQKKQTLIKTNDLPTDIGGIGTYNGNIYLLDKSSGQILKFVSSGSTFTKTNYLTGNTTQDFSKVNAITVDTSIWVLFNDGSIKKFTKGKPDDFKVSGLDGQLNRPLRIYTDVDTDNFYILDTGNSRIIVLGKNGVYQMQYKADILKTAKDFEVLEKEKKIFVLQNGKIWQIDFK